MIGKSVHSGFCGVVVFSGCEFVISVLFLFSVVVLDCLYLLWYVVYLPALLFPPSRNCCAPL